MTTGETRKETRHDEHTTLDPPGILETLARQNFCIGNDVQDEQWFDVRCGQCGRRLRIRLVAIQDARTIDCADCLQRQETTRREDNSETDADISDVEIGHELPR